MSTNTITYDSIFDYSEFISDDFPRGESLISDCTLIVGDERIRSHTIILASSSVFFYNAFTSGMHEDLEREVRIYYNPNGAFLPVLRWFYTGRIDVTPENAMCLFAVSRFYGVRQLEASLAALLRAEVTTPELLVQLINTCYEAGLNSELRFLVAFIADFHAAGRLTTAQLSDVLDVPTFCLVLAQRRLTVRALLDTLSEFIGTFACSERDVSAVKALFDLSDVSVAAALRSARLPWLPL